MSELLYITRDSSVWIVSCFNNRRDLYTKLYNTNIIQVKVGKRLFFYLLTKPGAKAKVNNVHTRTAIFVEPCYNLINALSM